MFGVTDNVSTLQSNIAALKEREANLLQEKQEREEDFGRKRAKFKEIFLAKEGELVDIVVAH